MKKQIKLHNKKNTYVQSLVDFGINLALETYQDKRESETYYSRNQKFNRDIVFYAAKLKPMKMEKFMSRRDIYEEYLFLKRLNWILQKIISEILPQAFSNISGEHVEFISQNNRDHLRWIVSSSLRPFIERPCKIEPIPIKTVETTPCDLTTYYPFISWLMVGLETFDWGNFFAEIIEDYQRLVEINIGNHVNKLTRGENHYYGDNVSEVINKLISKTMCSKVIAYGDSYALQKAGLLYEERSDIILVEMKNYSNYFSNFGEIEDLPAINEVVFIPVFNDSPFKVVYNCEEVEVRNAYTENATYHLFVSSITNICCVADYCGILVV